MPWHISKHGDGYYVIKNADGTKKNKKPMSKEKATRYLRALYANVPEATKKK